MTIDLLVQFLAEPVRETSCDRLADSLDHPEAGLGRGGRDGAALGGGVARRDRQHAAGLGHRLAGVGRGDVAHVPAHVTQHLITLSPGDLGKSTHLTGSNAVLPLLVIDLVHQLVPLLAHSDGAGLQPLLPRLPRHHRLVPCDRVAQVPDPTLLGSQANQDLGVLSILFV